MRNAKSTVVVIVRRNGVERHRITENKVIYTDKIGQYINGWPSGKRYLDLNNSPPTYFADAWSVPVHRIPRGL